MTKKVSTPALIGIVLLVALVAAFATTFAQILVSGNSKAWLTSLITTVSVIGTLQALKSK
jgi:hypothetical protein